MMRLVPGIGLVIRLVLRTSGVVQDALGLDWFVGLECAVPDAALSMVVVVLSARAMQGMFTSTRNAGI